MPQKNSKKSSGSIQELIENHLKSLVDGQLTVSIQDGKVLHLTVTNLAPTLNEVSNTEVTEIDQNDLIKIEGHINSLRYGTIVIKLRDRKIIGIEKNEKIKL